jgi:hypothetical protein
MRYLDDEAILYAALLDLVHCYDRAQSHDTQWLGVHVDRNVIVVIELLTDQRKPTLLGGLGQTARILLLKKARQSRP